MYTELKDGSRNVSVVLRNLTARPIHLARGPVIRQVAAANAVPEAQCLPDLLKKLGDEGEDKPGTDQTIDAIKAGTPPCRP